MLCTAFFEVKQGDIKGEVFLCVEQRVAHSVYRINVTNVYKTTRFKGNKKLHT